MIWNIFAMMMIGLLAARNSSGAVKNENLDCWIPCGSKGGPCWFCGDGSCCRQGYTDGAGCNSTNGCNRNHCCAVQKGNASTPSGYTKGDDGFFYKAFEVERSWHDAQRICRGDGGNLAIIWDEQTRDVVRRFMTEGWIGLTDKWEERKWVTPDWKTIRYSNWDANEPNDAGDEDCAYQKSSKRWNDLPCGSLKKFICQVNPGQRLTWPLDGVNEAKTMIEMLVGNIRTYLKMRGGELVFAWMGVQNELKRFYGAIPAKALYDLHMKTLELVLKMLDDRCGKVELQFYPLHPGLDEEEKLRTWKYDDGVDSIIRQMVEKFDDNSCKLAEHIVPTACKLVQQRVRQRVPEQFSLSGLGEALRRIFFEFDGITTNMVKTAIPWACEWGKTMLREGIEDVKQKGPEKYKTWMCGRYLC